MIYYQIKSIAIRHMGKMFTIGTIIATSFFSDSSLLFAQSKAKAKLMPTKEKAVHHVKQETGGRILDVKQRSLKSGDYVWRVKFLKEGRIQFMDVAPQTFTD